MEETVAGYYHTLASSFRYTNEISQGMTGLLRRMMAALHVVHCSASTDDIPQRMSTEAVQGMDLSSFDESIKADTIGLAHLPDLRNGCDVICVASLLAFLELGCLYEEGFYTEEGLSLDVVRRIKHARRMGRHFALTYDQRYNLTPKLKLTTIVQDLTVKFATGFVKELETSEEEGMDSFHKACTSVNVLEAIRRHFESPILGKLMTPALDAALHAKKPMLYVSDKDAITHIVEKKKVGSYVPLGELVSVADDKLPLIFFT